MIGFLIDSMAKTFIPKHLISQRLMVSDTQSLLIHKLDDSNPQQDPRSRTNWAHRQQGPNVRPGLLPSLRILFESSHRSFI